MLIAVIDGQGGGIGRQIVELLRPHVDKERHMIVAVGTNAAATAAMRRAGADESATGANAVCVMAQKADIITGPIGILMADSMMGELSAEMAAGVARSKAYKVVVPVGKCRVQVAGTQGVTLQEATKEAVARIVALLQQ
jgi:hypothetical protein